MTETALKVLSGALLVAIATTHWLTTHPRRPLPDPKPMTLKREDNENFLRAMKRGLPSQEGSIGVDRAYLLLEMIDDLRAELFTTQARLTGTVSAIPVIAANHTSSLLRENERLRAALQDCRDVIHGEVVAPFPPEKRQASIALLTRVDALLKGPTA
jgi:hypothetical protein